MGRNAGGGGRGSSGGISSKLSRPGDVDDFKLSGESDATAINRLNRARETAVGLNASGEYNGIGTGDKVSFFTMRDGQQTGEVVGINYGVGNIEFPVNVSITIRDSTGRNVSLGPLSPNAFSLYNIRPSGV